jgi:hypothetical protein
VPGAERRLKGKVRAHLPALVAYVLLTLLWLHPVLGDPAGRVIGDTRSDVWHHVWTHWHLRYWLARGVVSPAHTPFINAPEGGSLFDQNLFNGLLGLLCWWDEGYLLTTNVTLALELLLTAGAAYLLALELTGSRAGALLAGVAYAFSPYFLGYPLSSGVHERATGWSIPFYFWALIRLLRLGGVARAALLGLAAELAGIGCIYYLIFCAVGSGALVLMLLVHEAVLGRRSRIVLGVKRLLLAAPFLILGLLPLELLLTRQFAGQSVIYRARTEFWSGFDDYRDVLPLREYFRPQRETRQPQTLQDLLYKIAYVGWALMGTAFAALLVARRRIVAVAMILSLGSLFFLLSLGPGYRGGIWNVGAWLSRLLLSTVPYYNILAGIWQQIVVTELCLGLAAAFLVAEIVRPGIRWATAAACGALMLLETIFLSGAPFPLPTASPEVPSVYSLVEAGPAEAIVLDLPLFRGRSDLAPSEYMYYQTQHHRPIVHSIDAYTMACNDLFRLSSPAPRCPEPGPEDLEAFLRALRERRITWVAVHTRYLAPGIGNLLATLLPRSLGPAVDATADKSVLLYVVPGPTANIPLR